MASYRYFNQLGYRQAGIGLTGLVVWLGVFSFLFIIAAKLVPAYFEGYEARKTLESIKSDASVNRKSETEILAVLLKRLNINEVHRVKKENIVFSRSERGMVVRIVYEARIPMVGNADIILSFDNQVELTFP